jgi:hypothetical protein
MAVLFHNIAPLMIVQAAGSFGDVLRRMEACQNRCDRGPACDMHEQSARRRLRPYRLCLVPAGDVTAGPARLAILRREADVPRVWETLCQL